MIIFDKMSSLIQERVEDQKPGLYLALMLPIAFAFTITFAISRMISLYAPWLYLQWTPHLHVHHFTYGFFILAIAGFLALIFSGPRATFRIALLYGVGLALAMDEFGMWLRLSDDDVARSSYDGLNIVIGLIFFIIALPPGIRLLQSLWPFTARKL